MRLQEVTITATFESSRLLNSLAVATASATPVVVTVPHDERRESFVQIFSRRPGEQLVATIEVLSLANKTPGEKGRDLCLRKQQELLDSQVHLIEIDLLRGGAQWASGLLKEKGLLT
jgi:hypothetical protein